MISASTSRTERFPPPHLDAAIGVSSHDEIESFTVTDEFFTSSAAGAQKKAAGGAVGSVDYLSKSSSRSSNGGRREHNVAPSSILISAFRPHMMGHVRDARRNNIAHNKGRTSERAVITE